MARTAQVKRDARIGEAEAKRDSGIKVKTFVHKIVFKEGASVSKRPLVRERIKLCMLQLIGKYYDVIIGSSGRGGKAEGQI